MTGSEALMREILSDEHYEEEWKVVMNTRGQYTLSKFQALILQQEIANGNRGIVMFKTFSIPIPYIAEFYRVKRFIKENRQLSGRSAETPYTPIPREKWEKLKKEIYARVGKRIA